MSYQPGVAFPGSEPGYSPRMSPLSGMGPGGGGYGGPPQMQPQPGGGQSPISPGTITYTTSVGSDGRVVYHPFKAVPASYQTPQGVVSGIQWIPAEATSVIPAGAQPANAEFAASWNRGYLSEDDKKALEKWQKTEEKRRRREEKESAKRVAEWERERRDREKAEDREDRELRKARDRDSSIRERKRSTSAMGGANIPGNFPGGSPYAAAMGLTSPHSPGGIPGAFPAPVGPAPYGDRPYSTTGSTDLDRRLADLSLGGQGGQGAYARDRKMSTGAPAPMMPRSRRGSMNAGAYETARSAVSDGPYGGSGVGVPAYAQSGAGGYGSTTGSAYGAPPAGPYTTGRSHSRAPSPFRSPRPRGSPLPGDAPLPGGYGMPTQYDPQGGVRGGDPYARPVSPYSGGPAVGAGGAYPRGHVLEGQQMPRSPIPGMAQGPYGNGMPPGYPVPTAVPGVAGSAGGYPAGATSRPPSRLAGQMGGPYGSGGSAVGSATGADMLAPPEGFSRRPNMSQPYTAFEPLKIQDMDDFLEYIPRMPLVLTPHDVYHEDWIRFTTDVSLAWAGKMPLPNEVSRSGRAPRPSSTVADLVDLWNASFFLARGVEVVLYKGRERRSGPNAGSMDNIPVADDLDASSESSESSSESSEESDSERARYSYGGYGGSQAGGIYGRQDPQVAEMKEQRRRRRAEAKVEKKRRRKEKKLRRRAKERERQYSLYLTYVPHAGNGGSAGLYAQY